jgi:hypothetical protein
MLKHTLASLLTQAQVEASGRMHYSIPSQPYDIKGDLEVEDDDKGYEEALAQLQVMNLENIKSLRYTRMNQKESGKVTKNDVAQQVVEGNENTQITPKENLFVLICN